ncbi:uncharacterized protein LOC129232618 [Uloborus diversus]|uniref:uncharacterized protein LOC129232618 n=1 Tax=Uloborus diversus TaxID=327109 RepID=UPI0024091BF6|nr:uncharacterized protein LOC129232618 [Uloborus diversus]XP_054722735.1 uncharacterized protein LOC129232618 [Uloborus diversus]
MSEKTMASKQEDFRRELMEALHDATSARKLNSSARIQAFAETVKRRLENLIKVLDERGIQYYPSVIDLVETLKTKLENAMGRRRNTRVSGVVGNVMRIAGSVFYASTVGQIAFWIGLVTSSLSDIMADAKGQEIGNLLSEISAILETDRQSFKAVAKAIQELDEIIAGETGWSLFDEEFQEFLRNAVEAPAKAIEWAECAEDNRECRQRLIDLVRNRNLLTILMNIIDGFEREDVILLNVVTQAMVAYSFIDCTPVQAVAIQVGELAVRGLNLYIEYKHDAIKLKQVNQGIANMRKELEALRKVHPES